MRLNILTRLFVIFTLSTIVNNSLCQNSEVISPRYNVTLKEAHIGSLKVDTMLLNSYEVLPPNITKFYLDARTLFEINKVNYTDSRIIASAAKYDIKLMAGPMLGDIKDNSVTMWFRPSNKLSIHIKVVAINSNKEKNYILKPIAAGKDHRIVINDLSPSTKYKYSVIIQDAKITEGTFRTPSKLEENNQIRIAFGSCFHKIGIHNSNLINTILEREPNAMLLLGDIAVDDRENNFSMHNSDYLLRDVSNSWKKLSANIPLYTCWDDHDYLNDDLSGIPKNFTENDRDNLRTIWHQNWNNPQIGKEGIYFNTRIGNVELIMLDTRSCRLIDAKGERGSYLGFEQLKWLKNVLENSTATFKIISSGTMWSDYISNGKDSWGTWDKLAREEIFNHIETKNIAGVLLISGDRHGARGFTIPRTSGFKLFEFEAASLGGVPGPPAMAQDTTNQLFGYEGSGLKAFGEFTFDVAESKPQATFRLIDENGNIMEKHTMLYDLLSPEKSKK